MSGPGCVVAWRSVRGDKVERLRRQWLRLCGTTRRRAAVRSTLGGDPDRIQRYQAASESNGHAAQTLTAAKVRQLALMRQRAAAQGELAAMIERAAARTRRDTTA